MARRQISLKKNKNLRLNDDVRTMYNCFWMPYGSDIDHFNSPPPELTVLPEWALHAETTRPIRSSYLAAIIQVTKQDVPSMRNATVPYRKNRLYFFNLTKLFIHNILSKTVIKWNWDVWFFVTQLMVKINLGGEWNITEISHHSILTNA